MKNLVVAMMLALPMTSWASAPCQEEIDRQNEGLAYESSATPHTHEEVREMLGPDAEIDPSEVTLEDYQRFQRLLKREDTLFFSYGNDAGLWISVANAKTCKKIWTTQIVAY